MPGGFINGGFNIGRAVFPVPFGAFLLDTFSGAAAAYSFERLATSTSSVVRVRRSFDDTEQDFTAPQVTDGTLTTFTGAGDGFVTTWYDQSGNSRDATQATAASQPQIVSAGDLVAGGIDFDGTDDKLDFTGTAKTDFYVASVVTFDDVSSQRRILGDEANNSEGFGIANATTAFWRGAGGTAEQPLLNTTLATSTEYLYTLGRSGTSLQFYVNGSDGPDAGTSSDVFTPNSIGSATNPIDGKINAILVYDSDQTANRAAIEAKLAEIYGITLA